MLVDLKQKSQVTIPKELVKKLNLQIGDKLELVEKDGKIIITPVVVIPKDQAWYYTKKWQQMEGEVDEQIEKGQVHQAKDKDELFKGLGLDDI
ncbi:AbrB/MazE/SpoVT family DNA-binding domain-containing protein [Herbivorax sp. ANBcel31]|uniref:AbrB/MazE/SpoVT family DNA-binding domain-containing protein n=1 Tax=Herbivorax sp. ANBcel31 TaxID=3069754 RepID=UPI0027AEDD01|nr:AbrB/MazE/SpoVT family DNA-binding domain-containing protein [Herbivorax sp. ANBcel31]MDQ2088127.1 AbrB/MazE/SpoVT family DNA-binding domain-containing protein [Herbivorax sp. ANBcel31]